MIGLIMFAITLILLMVGFPVAFTFAGVAVIFGVLTQGVDLFAFMPYRIMSIMQNTILMAVPLFVFMGIVLQKTKLAEQLLEAMGDLFGNVRGGLAVSTILVGSLLAASTGVVGASVVAMGVISLPVMLKHNYKKTLSTGVICASGTLGQIIPPSIVLIILADVLGVSTGDLFKAAVMPSLILVGGYIAYVLVISYLDPEVAPAFKSKNHDLKKIEKYKAVAKAIVPPITLIIAVLGSIFSGIATPTESASIGAVGSLVLAFFYQRLNWEMLRQSSVETVKVTAMVFAILVGATAFSMVFTYSGGDVVVEDFIHSLPAKEMSFILISMLVIFILGFFIDFVEISLIIVPIFYPTALSLGIDMQWFAILIAMNLQTSFLTPPFGFSLFYLKGVAPKSIQTTDIYKGVMPFIAIQVTLLISLIVFPQWYGFNGS
ncbi:TRAP dicarboxylate transporter, DctM subunit, unknown substrate 6 [Bathymodiolus thermophilus thioautotrophic gill symbiont]|uniref:TRAP transporter large permease protein n=1 Tax=Bathymodiolus thermophilus thioautotrophic gill symbiont TaxID=2360 RepID=A0A1J5TYJ6_9GAMM|nr:TRAP transporter large permease subunit [Bathymodiolus thermophilus thioautotrophic gill symbiont]AYQ56234.1 C4-dicarboxylate ABC transporter [Bathymodiolus thermophilus thioautotrophic gill symbiont]OIR25260.1 C4-dicarboxylate ABC transporter [Bathymodiolus thermophilus thioautotrophic gill symbiont]CAB5501306.1 TRAP dicarboxylate transporter, DctM subunit, unknown substrate 6 [Bathymodiolus thermophilus thioautotrophic gill symbiont]CAB5505729.1 TRAP dicarboxylate transporter, DctM subunit